MSKQKSYAAKNAGAKECSGDGMSWKVVAFEPGEHRKGIELVTLFKAECVGPGRLTDTVIFTNHDANHVRCFYFSPDAVRVFGSALETLGAIDSDAPQAADQRQS